MVTKSKRAKYDRHHSGNYVLENQGVKIESRKTKINGEED